MIMEPKFPSVTFSLHLVYKNSEVCTLALLSVMEIHSAGEPGSEFHQAGEPGSELQGGPGASERRVRTFKAATSFRVVERLGLEFSESSTH